MSVEDRNESLKKLLILKSNLEIALEINDIEEIRKNYEEIKNIYNDLMGKDFEKDISEEKLKKIKEILKNGEKDSDEELIL